MKRVPIKELQARGRALKKLKAQKPKGVAWIRYVKEQAGITAGRANWLIQFADGGLNVETFRSKAAERQRAKRRVLPQWVRINIRHVDPRVTMGVIRFLIERSVNVMRPHFSDVIPDFLNDLRTMINNVEINWQLNREEHDNGNGKISPTDDQAERILR
jgi:hypothetical protein